MFANDCRGVVAPRVECSANFMTWRCVAQCDGQVTQPAFVTDTANRATGEAPFEFLAGLGKEFG